MKYIQKLLLLATFIIGVNATEPNPTQICQSFNDGVQTRVDGSKIKFINHSYLFNNPDNLLDGFQIKNNNSDLSCRDVNGNSDEECQSSNALGVSLSTITLEAPEVFTFIEDVNSTTYIKRKKLNVKKNRDLNLTASSAIYLEKLTLAKNATVTIQAPKVVINNLKSFKKSNIKIIADTIDIKIIRLENRADLIIEPFTEDAKIDMRVEKLKLKKASVLLNNGLYHIKRVELKNRSSLDVGDNVQIVNRRVIALNHSRVNASKNTPICDDEHNPNALFIYSNDLVRVENHSKIVAMVYNDRRVELIGHSGVKGAVSAKNRAIIKNHSKVCYSKCNITPPSVDTTPPVITLNGDSNITVTQGESYNELGATAVDDVDGNVSVTISGSVDTSTVGVYTITYTATDSSNNSATITRTVNVEEPEATLISITVSPNPIGLRVNRSVQVKVVGNYSDGTTNVITEDISYVLADDSFVSVDSDGLIEATSEGNTTLNVSVNSSFSTSVAVTVAKELNTTNFNSTNFGTEYIDVIPIDATVESYDEKRFCMIAGQILAEDDSPLEGVKVSILNHAEYGSTLTDSNGTYAIPSEGGLQLTMHYQKSGYTTVDRNIQAPVQDWVRTPNVTMLELDSKVTAIDLNDSTPQIHISTPVADDRGERSTTLVFSGVTKATVTAKDGSTRELTNINVRATEFKTPESMPSDLPTNTAYTYCSDLTVDGVSDDENVTFDAPVIMYVDNFLGFDVGEIVPIGYYDRNDGKWKASKNGVVVKLLDVDNDGVVDALDSTGDNAPNDLNGDGSFLDEVLGIADNEQYSAGKTYWRAEITHFTPWDHNWPYGPPEDAVKPNRPNPTKDSDEPSDCHVDVSSYVTSKSRVFHEDIPIAGTDITLHYASNRVSGYKHVIDASVDASSLPSSISEATVTMEVAGRVFSKDVTLGELNNLTFEWDGRDALGNLVSGEVKAKVTTTYRYNLVYYRATSAFVRAWNRAGVASTNIIGRSKINYSSSKTIRINVDSNNNNSKIANGWTLSNVHGIGVNAIYKGDGTKVEKMTSLEDGLVAYYRFEGDAKDSSYNGLDGIEVGNISYVNGIIGQALKLDGSSHINLESFSNEDISKGLTYSYWFKKYTPRYEVVFSQYTWGTDGHVFAHSITDNIISSTFYCNLDGTCTDSITASYTEDFQWHHVVVNSKTNTFQIWIDGQLINEIPKTGNPYVTNSSIQTYIGNIGLAGDGSDKHFRGELDDFRVYNRELSSDEIENIYLFGREGLTSYTIDGLNISDKNLEYQFNLDGKHIATKAYPSHKILETYSYDENGYLISITDRFNQTTTITRDSNGNPTQITAPNGQITNLLIDENGDLTEVVYEDNSKYQFTYFDGSLMDKMTDPNGNEIKHLFSGTGRIIKEIDGENGSYQFVNLNGVDERTYKTIFPEGDEQSSKHTTLTNGSTKIETILATGESVVTTFSADEKNIESSQDGVVTKTLYTVDSLTHQKTLKSTETTQPSGLKSVVNYAITYDGNETDTNSKTTIITTNSKTTTMLEDYNAGKVTVTTPMGRTITREYDVNTLLTSKVTSGTLTPTTYIYDSKGRRTSSTTGTRTTSYTYGTRGNVATITNSKGEVTSFTYDIMDRLIGVTHPNGTTESYVYDKNGNMTKFTTPRPSIYNFAFNGVDKRVALTSPLGKTTTYTYNKNRRLTKITRPSGKTVVNNYTNDRLNSTVTAEGTTSYSYLFANKIGSITNGSESINFEYDGTLLTKMTQTGLLNQAINYTYDNDFKVTSTTYAGATQNYSYDNDGLLITSGAYTLTRDAQNAYTTNVTDGTLNQNRTYNSYGEITKVEDESFTYEITQRDNAGAITQKTETLNGTTTTYDYTFDNMGRLTQVKKDNVVVESYSYDNNGNRATATVDGTTTTASYTLDDQLEVYGDNTYHYDNDGYLDEKTTPNGTTTYEYGTLGELKKVVTPTKTIEYKHNANNQRVAKLVDGVVVEKYLWANLTTLLAIYDKDDNLIQRFEYADQRVPISMTSNGQKYYLHYDQVGTLKAVTDTTHNIIKEISYDTYGNILADSNPSFKVPFGFAGGLYDTDTKLTRFGYRDYDAYTGKWTAKDPIDFGGGDSNLYGYVLQDPVNFVDINGLLSASIIWNNRYFLYHYFFGRGHTMNITPSSHHGQLIIKHLNDLMKKNYQTIMKEASENCSGNYNTKIVNKVNFTGNEELFSIGDSHLVTKAYCTNGKCLISYNINDAFIDALDIHDSWSGNQDIPIIATPYNIRFRYNIMVGF